MAGEGYHFFYNMQVVNQNKENKFYPQAKLFDYALYLLATLIPALLMAGFGLVSCMFSDQSKILKKAGLFRLIALGYYVTMIYGLYLIWDDWYFQHHNNYRMMSYMFYLKFVCQFGGAFLYSIVFRWYTSTSEPCECEHHGFKSKKD